MSSEAPGTVTCYRHPGREAPLRCTRCGRPICLDDAIDAPVGYLCPECAQTPRRQVRAARRGQPTLTIGLVVALVAIWLLQQTSDQWFLQGALAGPLVAAGEWWRVVTGAFLHDQTNILHVGFNAYLLYLLGQMLEPGIGTSRFAAIYAAGLLGGSAGALLLSWGAATIGASGAVFGLMGAAMVGFRQRGINPWRTGIGMLVILNLVFTFLVAGVSIGGHIGGLLGGALAGLPIFHSDIGRTRAGIAVAWAIAAALGVLAVGLGVAGPVI